MLPESSDPEESTVKASASAPLVFAHRGSSAVAAEHTIEAYQRAIDEGADGLECDVRLTRDGHLICIHDSRLDRTSNGRGRVSRATLAELSELDFSSWHPGDPADRVGEQAEAFEIGLGEGSAPPPVPDPAGERRLRAAGILTLDRLLNMTRDAGRPLRLLIETKHPTRYGATVERALVAMLDRHGLVSTDPVAPVQVTVMSFAATALRRIRLMAPGLDTVYLMEWVPPGVPIARLPFGAKIFGPKVTAVRARPDLIPQARARGYRSYVWTVNTPAEVDLVLAQGADGIISDRPGYVLSQLGR